MIQKNTFAQAILQPAVQAYQKPITARTLNGMRARSTTSSTAVDLFGSIGASRGKDLTGAFSAVYAENKDLALRIAQWSRDVRGGAGEREIYLKILLWLEANDPDTLVSSKLLNKLPELGRFKDLLIFRTANVKARAYSIYIEALRSGNGLAAKWAPRKGPIALELRRLMGLTPRAYRKLLVSNTNVVETQMCAREFNSINFSHVPSVAMSRYMTAFHKRAPEAFQAYKDALKRNDGTAKANASAVYPYDIVRMLGGACDLSYYARGGVYSSIYGAAQSSYAENTVAQAMWDALPDYMNGANVIAVCDNSGSMSSPIKDSKTNCANVAASLTMYVADKSKGAFKDLSITFNDNAEFVVHKGGIHQRLEAICRSKWGSTNLNSVYKLILNHARKNRVPAEDMPKIILILSDMQFNADARDRSAQELARQSFEDAGYEVPTIVYWNLHDYGNKPVKFNEQGTALVSGFSPAIMKSILAADLNKFSPESIMLQTVGVDRYSW